MKKLRIIGAWLFVTQLVAFSCAAGVQVDHLRCEYRENPLGIDLRTPRLSWQLRSSERGGRQTAYRILVASSAELLKRGQGDLWDSGKVVSDQSIQVHYAGKPPASREECFWKVEAWDQDNRASGWSPVATWEMGLPEATDWKGARWIRLAKDTRNSPLVERSVQTKRMNQPRMAKAFPSPLFRREFSLKSGIIRARAYVCGLGYNEVYVNGQRCGGAVLDPGQTTYDVRAFYVAHDITKLLRQGQNAVGIMLGNGFFGQNHAFNTTSLCYGPPALIAKIIVDYADGSTQVISTDNTWKADTGPILYDNVYGGETYDARLERTGWTRPGYDDSSWTAAVSVPSPTKSLQAQMIPPIRCITNLLTKKIIAGENGKWIFDLGQNIAGWARIHVKEPAGTKITLRFAEVLMPDGRSLDPATTGGFATGLEQTDIYVCKGGGLETWQPRFTYHGFRYVEVSGLPSKPDKNFLEGVLVRTDVPRAGTFACSDETLNRIYQTSLWTIEDNLHSTAEDCPHREKCGWLGDAEADAETGIYNFNMAQFWTKFVDDIETVLGRGGVTYWGQRATPGIPCNIAVGKRLCQEARPDWGAAYVLIPWYLYRYYDDTEVFKAQYPHLKRWIEYVKGLREDGIVVRGYGDWCPPGGNTNMECPPSLTSTAIYYGTLRIMQTFAGQLGKEADTKQFLQLAAETKAAFNRKFYDESTHGYGSQTADAVALRFGLQPDGQGSDVAGALVSQIVNRHGGHAFAGIHGGRALYAQLSDYGHTAVAISAMKQKTWPSYAYALAHGFTTWPEQFDEIKPGERIGSRSLNHPMQSGFALWFHEDIGGIQPAAPGFKRILLEPHGFHQLVWANAEHDSLYGPIVSNWRRSRGKFDWSVSVPANTTATAFLPAKDISSVKEGGHTIGQSYGVRILRFENGRAVLALASGTYHFQSDL